MFFDNQKINTKRFLEYCVVVFGLLLAQTQKYFFIFSAQTQKCLCHSKQMPNKKNDGTLPAPIHFNVNELLYLYNKCNEICIF